MNYTLRIDTAEMDTFLDIFIAGLEPDGSDPLRAGLIEKVAALGTEYENDRMAGVK